jgi:hypothetical protein
MYVTGPDSLKSRRALEVEVREYDYFSLNAAGKAAGLGDIARLPFSMKVLLENPVRLKNGRTATLDDIKAVRVAVSFCDWPCQESDDRRVEFSGQYRFEQIGRHPGLLGSNHGAHIQ